MRQKQQQETNSDLLELIKIAESSEQGEVALLEDDLFSFLQFFSLKKGEELILKSVIYDLYKNWSEYPMDKKAFGTKMVRYVEDHTKGSRTYYRLNRDSFSLNAEVLRYLEKKKINKTKYLPWKNHFECFLNQHGISAGKKWVPSSALKMLYDKWSYNNNKKSLLSEKQLVNFLKLYFKHKRNGESRMQWFAVNEQFVLLHLTDNMLKLKTTQRKTHNEKKQKTKG